MTSDILPYFVAVNFHNSHVSSLLVCMHRVCEYAEIELQCHINSARMNFIANLISMVFKDNILSTHPHNYTQSPPLSFNKQYHWGTVQYMTVFHYRKSCKCTICLSVSFNCISNKPSLYVLFKSSYLCCIMDHKSYPQYLYATLVFVPSIHSSMTLSLERKTTGKHSFHQHSLFFKLKLNNK